MAISNISYFSCIQVKFFLVAALLGNVFSTHSVVATSCQVYPSEYAYKDDSVVRTESASANCRNYPEGNVDGTVHPEHYIHCDGTQLKLADSNFGQEQYQPTDYYVWSRSSTSGEQVLFIFPTRVSLTNITLHYYSDSVRGLPRLRFYAVPDDFDVWDVPATSTPYVDVVAVPPGGEPAGHRNVDVSINVNFDTKRVLMYKYTCTKSFQFALSEVEFFNCTSSSTIAPSTKGNGGLDTQATTSDKTPPLNIGESDSSYTSNRSGGSIEVLISPITTTNNSAESIEVDYDNVETTSEVVTVAIVLGIIIPILLVLASIVVITLVLHLRKSTGFKQDDDHSYSTLNRENPQQAQPQSSNVGLYDQIQLSPSTGQAEVYSNAEIEHISTLSSHDTDNSPSSEKQQSGQSSVSTCEQPTYSVVKKSKGKKPRKDQNSAAKQKEEALCPFTSTTKTDIKQVQKNHDQKKLQRKVTLSSSHTTESPEALYTAVKKKPKADKEEKVPPTPPHSVEELYTAVKKRNVKGSAMKEGTSQIPPHRVEDLYTAVMKKPNNNPATDNASPSIPPHTIEELYTAVQKGSAIKGEEEAPPIPPYTVEDS